ncbi:MAG: TolC family protein [Nitrospirota bacterium]|nr:TolC family protein [Nitrospirota bacterium]
MPVVFYICLLFLATWHPVSALAQPNDSAPNAASSSGKNPAPQPATSPAPFLSLREAIGTGLEKHPLIERARATLKSAAAETKQDQGRQYPWLEASVAGGTGSIRVLSSDGANIHATGDLGSSFLRGLRNRAELHQYGGGRGYALAGALPKHNQNMMTGGLLLNQLITDFGATAHHILASQATETATEKDILTNKALVILNVQQAYLTCLMQQRLVEIAAENLEKRALIQKQLQALTKHQLKSKLDLDLVTVQVKNAELALIKAQNDLSQAFAALNNAMGVEGPNRYELEKVSMATAPPPAMDQLVEEGLKNRPELLGEQHRLVATQELLQEVRAFNLGEISTVGTIGITKYGDVHDGGIPQDGVAPLWGFGVSARLPLFTGFKIQNQIVEAGHRKGETEQEIQNLANEVILQVIRASLNQTTAAEQIVLEQERVAFAREAVNLAQERYRLGLSAIVEVVRAATALFDAESRLAEAQYVYKKSQALVAYAAGQDYQKF